MTTKTRGFMNNQVTVRFTGDLLDRVDRLADDAITSRGSWIRTAVLEKLRNEEQLYFQRSQTTTGTSHWIEGFGGNVPSVYSRGTSYLSFLLPQSTSAFWFRNPIAFQIGFLHTHTAGRVKMRIQMRIAMSPKSTSNK